MTLSPFLFTYCIPSQRALPKPAAQTSIPSFSFLDREPRNQEKPTHLSENPLSPRHPFFPFLPRISKENPFPILFFFFLTAKPKGKSVPICNLHPATPTGKKKENRETERTLDDTHQHLGRCSRCGEQHPVPARKKRPIGSSLQPKEKGLFDWAAALGQACPQEYQGRDVRSKTR